MMRFIWFCAAGDSFFLGASLMILAVALSTTRTGPAMNGVVRATLIAGLAALLLAAMPLAPMLYGVLTIGAILLIGTVGSRRHPALRGIGQASVVVVSALLILLELSFEMNVRPPRGEPLYVIGDSVSAGIQGPNERTWPALLAENYGIEVVNLAESGATAASALKQGERIGPGPGLVLLEIGGNDLFTPTPPAQFRKDLARLLERVARPDRPVLMLELPILPWQIRYGRIQRQAAASCGVTLVPKRFFAGVLRQDGSTLDLAHLSALGHQRMADAVAGLLGLTERRVKSNRLFDK
jgi:lysophospholipase L1-like esterase